MAWQTTAYLDQSYVATATTDTAAASSSPTGEKSSGSARSSPQALDLFVAKPSSPTAASTSSEPSTRPLIVYVHGGLWVDRDKADYQALGAHWSRTLGAHVAVVNYRQSSKLAKGDRSKPGVILHPTHTSDVLQSLRWLCDATTTQAFQFAFRDIFLVGHSCGAHIAGLLCLASSGASELPDLSSSASLHALSLVRGVIGVEGIYDCCRFADDFPDWSQGIVDAFGAEKQRWESPQDYLLIAAEHSSEKPSPSRAHIQSALASQSNKLPTPPAALVPWLVVHSKEDPWVNLPQAQRFHDGLLATNHFQAATASSSSSNTEEAKSNDAAAGEAVPASALLLITGAHFEVIEQVGGAHDQLTKPIASFVSKVLARSA